MFRNLTSFMLSERGVTMVEYGLIAALISVASIGALGRTGGNLRDMFDRVGSCLQHALTGMAC